MKHIRVVIVLLSVVFQCIKPGETGRDSSAEHCITLVQVPRLLTTALCIAGNIYCSECAVLRMLCEVALLSRSLYAYYTS